MWTIIFLSVYIILALSIVFSLLLHGAKPTKTLAWLLIVFTIPVRGIFLYILLGRNRRKKKLLRLEKSFPRFSTKHAMIEGDNWKGEYEKPINLIYKNCNFAVTCNNRIQALKSGKTTFDSIFEALNKAEKQIHLQYYIFEEGDLADKLLQLFEQKISQGVEIRMIYDGVGSFSLSKSYLNKLLSIGVEVYPFLPFKFGRFLRSVSYRNHRK